MPAVLEVLQTAGNVVEYQMTVEIPKEQIATEIESKLKNLAKTTKIKGFRQGKVPLRIVDQKFGQWVRQEVVGQLIDHSFRDAVQQQQLQPLGPPAIQFEGDALRLEQGIVYKAIFTAISPQGSPVVNPTPSESPFEINDIPLFTATSDQRTTQVTDTAMPVIEIDGLRLDQPLVDDNFSANRPPAGGLPLDDPLKEIPFFTAPVPKSSPQSPVQFGSLILETEREGNEGDLPIFTLSPEGQTPVQFTNPLSEPTFTLFPEKSKLVVDGLTVEKWVAQVTDDDVETMLNRLRQQRQTWQEVADAQMGDKVTLDLVGTINGEPFKNNEIKQLSLILGENRLGLPTFETHLIGVQTGAERIIEVMAPPEHYNPEFAGKTIRFTVQVHAVTRPQLPPLDTEFAKVLGVESGDLATLRQDTRETMTAQLQEVLNYRLRQQVLIALLKANPIEAPATLIAQEQEYLLQQALQQVPAQHHATLTADRFSKEAEKRIQLGLLTVQVAKDYGIQIGAEEMRQRVEKIALAYENSDDIINQYYADPQRLGEIYSLLLEEQVATWLLSRARIVEKKTDFYTAMNSQI
jgi:trigger factor